jgi:hypothetical protein
MRHLLRCRELCGEDSVKTDVTCMYAWDMQGSCRGEPFGQSSLTYDDLRVSVKGTSRLQSGWHWPR